MLIQAPISVGELLDKISVLEIKMQAFATKEGEAWSNVRKERDALLELAEGTWDAKLDALYWQLRTINKTIWDAVDQLHVADKSWFRNPFRISSLARTIYLENDRRAEIKREINNLTRSEIVEEKVYR